VYVLSYRARAANGNASGRKPKLSGRMAISE
jgi:hypothetical protein